VRRDRFADRNGSICQPECPTTFRPFSGDFNAAKGTDITSREQDSTFSDRYRSNNRARGSLASALSERASKSEKREKRADESALSCGHPLNLLLR